MSKEKTKEIIEKINIKKGEEDMVIENLQRIWDDTYNEGVKDRKENRDKNRNENGNKNRKNVVIEMLKNKMDDETIKKLTKIENKDLKKIKKELGLANENYSIKIQQRKQYIKKLSTNNNFRKSMESIQKQ